MCPGRRALPTEWHTIRLLKHSGIARPTPRALETTNRATPSPRQQVAHKFLQQSTGTRELHNLQGLVHTLLR